MDEAPLRGGTVGRIYLNLGRLLGGKAAAGVISLAYMALAARALGPADYGVLILVHGYAMTVGGLVGFPGWHAVVRYGAQALATGDDARLTRLLRLTGLVEGAGGVLAVIAAALLAPLVGPRLGWSPTAVAFALPYSLAVLASARATPAGYLQLAGRFDLLGVHSVVAPLIRLAGAATAIALHAGLLGFLIVWLAAAVAEWAAMWTLGLLVARRQLPRTPLLGAVRGAVAENPGFWRFMIAANADITFSELSGRIAPLAVGWLLGPAAAGLYAIAQRLTTVLSQPALTLGQAAYAELARLAAAGGHGAPLRQALLRCVGVALLAAAPIVLMIALFGRRLAVLVGGAAFAGAAGIMLWLALARTVYLAVPPVSAALTALGRPGLSVACNMVCGLGMLAVLPPMLSRLGLGGAGLNALLQAAATASLLTWCIWRVSGDSPKSLGAAAK
ncbi:MAG: rane protein [Phenylobacterium sp.]|nr:rane protein [Phenylobacterium sp.]